MIDFHNHVLPGVDDGSKNMEMTLNMLRTASAQGVKKIINTTHLQHPKMEGKNTDFKYIQDISKTVIDEAKSKGIDIDIKIVKEIGVIKHQYSHFKVIITLFKCNYISGTEKAIASQEIRWIGFNQKKQFAFPVATHKLFKLLDSKS